MKNSTSKFSNSLVINKTSEAQVTTSRLMKTISIGLVQFVSRNKILILATSAILIFALAAYLCFPSPKFKVEQSPLIDEPEVSPWSIWTNLKIFSVLAFAVSSIIFAENRIRGSFNSNSKQDNQTAQAQSESDKHSTAQTIDNLKKKDGFKSKSSISVDTSGIQNKAINPSATMFNSTESDRTTINEDANKGVNGTGNVKMDSNILEEKSPHIIDTGNKNIGLSTSLPVMPITATEFKEKEIASKQELNRDVIFVYRDQKKTLSINPDVKLRNYRMILEGEFDIKRKFFFCSANDIETYLDHDYPISHFDHGTQFYLKSQITITNKEYKIFHVDADNFTTADGLLNILKSRNIIKDKDKIYYGQKNIIIYVEGSKEVPDFIFGITLQIDEFDS